MNAVPYSQTPWTNGELVLGAILFSLTMLFFWWLVGGFKSKPEGPEQE